MSWLGKVDSYVIARDEQGQIIDFLLQPSSKFADESDIIPMCGNRFETLAAEYLEILHTEDHGHLVTFEYDDSVDITESIRNLKVITNRCLMTPEFVEFKQPSQHFFIPGASEKRIMVGDPMFSFHNTRNNFGELPTVRESTDALIFNGWQPQKSLVGSLKDHMKNIADLTMVEVPLLTRDSYHSIDVSAYKPSLVIGNLYQSYQVYKEFLYESNLVRFRMKRLIAVVYMQEEPKKFGSIIQNPTEEDDKTTDDDSDTQDS